VIRAIAHANVAQLVSNKKIVKTLPGLLNGLTSLNPAVVIEIVVM
jgi:hypothetical protein